MKTLFEEYGLLVVSIIVATFVLAIIARAIMPSSQFMMSVDQQNPYTALTSDEKSELYGDFSPTINIPTITLEQDVAPNLISGYTLPNDVTKGSDVSGETTYTLENALSFLLEAHPIIIADGNGTQLYRIDQTNFNDVVMQGINQSSDEQFDIIISDYAVKYNTNRLTGKKSVAYETVFATDKYGNYIVDDNGDRIYVKQVKYEIKTLYSLLDTANGVVRTDLFSVNLLEDHMYKVTIRYTKNQMKAEYTTLFYTTALKPSERF